MKRRDIFDADMFDDLFERKTKEVHNMSLTELRAEQYDIAFAMNPTEKDLTRLKKIEAELSKRGFQCY